MLAIENNLITFLWGGYVICILEMRKLSVREQNNNWLWVTDSEEWSQDLYSSLQMAKLKGHFLTKFVSIWEGIFLSMRLSKLVNVSEPFPHLYEVD